MRKTLKWVATENNLFTLFNKDVYATVEESANLYCSNCNLEFTSFSSRNFIKLRGFKEL